MYPQTHLTQLILAQYVFISSSVLVPVRKRELSFQSLRPPLLLQKLVPLIIPFSLSCLRSIFPSSVASSSLPSNILRSPEPLKLSQHLPKLQPRLFHPFTSSPLRGIACSWPPSRRARWVFREGSRPRRVG